MVDDKLTNKKRANREISNANLVKIKPGQVLNPSGRPPNIKYISDILKDLLVQKDAGSDKTNAELIAEAMVALAKDTDKRGHVLMLKELLDRAEGKVLDTHRIEIQPVSIVYRRKDAIQE